MNLESVTLSERIQTQRPHSSRVHYITCPEEAHPQRQEAGSFPGPRVDQMESER